MLWVWDHSAFHNPSSSFKKIVKLVFHQNADLLLSQLLMRAEKVLTIKANPHFFYYPCR